ncbi:MAG TPA: ATP-binding protein [Vicinamibacterales bacterium]|nr:ATP-binding protein [Vicinamibacterales bacterium]
MTQAGYTFLGLTAIVAVLVAVLAFALMRFAAAARGATQRSREGRLENAMLSAALQEAVGRLKAQERAMSARAVASEELSGQIVESLNAGLLVVDAARRVEILNAAGRRLLEVAGDPVGSGYQQLLAGVPALGALIDECLSTGQPIVRRSVQSSGAMRATHFGVTVSPLAGGGAPRGAICLFSDLTAVIELEEQLRLKDTLAKLGELTAGIAHEFRNGLATIHGYSRLLDPKALPPQYGAYVEGIRQEADALGKVVTNFLNFARPEQMVLAPVDLGALAGRVVEEMRRELPDGGTLQVTGRFARIQGDEVLLRQVLANLVRNAIEACQGAAIVPAVTIGGEIDERHRTLRVGVEDNGPGIPAAARDRIFQPFFTTRSAGTGLGLAIVQKIVVMHNGRVNARDGAAGGTRFEIALPLAEDPPDVQNS